MDSKKKQLIKYFNNLYSVEKKARDLYDNYLKKLKNPDHIVAINEIRDDKEKHIKIVKDIIKIIEKG